MQGFRNIKILKICLSILLFAGTYICSSTPIFADQFDNDTPNRNVAPERNYKRETMTFPAQKSRDKSTQEEEEEKVRTAKSKKKESALTNSIVPMIVMGVIVLGILLWLGLSIFKKLLPGGKQLFSTPGMEILGRTHFDSQKYLAIVRVGTRILVVGVSPNGFDQISEVTDPEEVTEILSSAKPKTSTGQNLFYKMFQKQVQKREGPAATTANTDPLATHDENVKETEDSSEEDRALSERRERIKKIRDLES